MITPAILASSKRGKTTVELWQERVSAAGGSFGANSVALAAALVAQLQAQTYYEKIVWLLPLLGVGINAARVPLIDRLNKGALSNTGFVDADFSEATGLDNSAEASKYLSTLIRPSELGSDNCGGLGWWELAWGNGSNVDPMGCYSYSGEQRFVIDLRAARQHFNWGSPFNFSGPAVSAVNGHFYGQRASTTARTLYRDGASVGVNATADSASGASTQIIAVHGCRYSSNSTPWKGRCGCAYLTAGNMTADEIAAFHTLLQTYLLQPTGRTP